MRRPIAYATNVSTRTHNSLLGRKSSYCKSTKSALFPLETRLFFSLAEQCVGFNLASMWFPNRGSVIPKLQCHRKKNIQEKTLWVQIPWETSWCALTVWFTFATQIFRMQCATHDKIVQSTCSALLCGNFQSCKNFVYRLSTGAGILLLAVAIH